MTEIPDGEEECPGDFASSLVSEHNKSPIEEDNKDDLVRLRQESDLPHKT
jgi:hypothetical protein